MPGRDRLQRGPTLPYELLAGVVPVPEGWLLASGKLIGIQVHPEQPSLVSRFREVLDNIPQFKIIAVTLPIGLPTSPQKGGRAADHAAREVLGFPHAGAIASTPTRASLACRAYEVARKANGGLLDIVTWQQFSKIRELDDEMQPYLQRLVFEVRPELSFLQLNDGTPMRHTKESVAGHREREALLLRRMPGSERILEAPFGRAVQRRHLVDAAVALWTARRIVARAVTRVPENPEWDEKGLRMEIVR